MDAPIVVMTTAGTEDAAETLAAAIVEARLAACVQVQRVRSFYVWDGALQREPEWLLLIKTREARWIDLEAFIRANHGYDTPEVLRLPVSGGSAAYLRWLSEMTAQE